LQNLAADVTYRCSWRPLRFLCRCYRERVATEGSPLAGGWGLLIWPLDQRKRIASARCVATIKSKSFRAPSAPEPPFSVWPEKRGPKRGHPTWRLLGLLPNKSVSRGRAFRTGILPVRKGIDIPVDASCAACRPRLTAAQGPRVEQRAIVARTLQKIRGNSKGPVRQRYSSSGGNARRTVPDGPLSTHNGRSQSY